jgi:uncharacterized protein (TIGR00255 family)
MTGIGVGEAELNDQAITVEIRSVNNRFLEVSTRLPLGLSSYEHTVKEIIRKAVFRGKLYINVNVQGDQNGYAKLKVIPETVCAVRQLLEDLKRETGVKEPLRLDHFLQYSEIFEPHDIIENADQLWIQVESALRQALDNLCKMRRQEGKALLKDLLKHLEQLESTVKQVDKLATQNIRKTHQKMVERVRNLTKDESLDEDRLYTEISILADKLDVTEECVRLESHHRLFRDTLKNESIVGKKLNFLLQEMNREVNTISAKANNAEISHHVVTMKEEIEKLREQIQNLE